MYSFISPPMVLAIVAYGDPVLRQRAQPVAADHPGLAQFIADLYETMYAADGVGLAAPQVGQSIRIFVVDAAPMATANSEGEGTDDASEQAFLKTLKSTFINPELYDEQGTPWAYTEGCLSIPGIREPVSRRPSIRLRWVDEQFQPHDECFTGLAARVIQHEYDHLEGKLFVDYASPLKKQLLRPKLDKISRGETDAAYPMRYPRRRVGAR